MVFRLLALAAAIAVTGCASNSGVAPGGNGSFTISAQAATGFSGLSDLRAGVMRQAADHCAKTGQDFTVTEDRETKPPYIFGNFPRVDLTFRCIAKT